MMMMKMMKMASLAVVRMVDVWRWRGVLEAQRARELSRSVAQARREPQ